MTKTQPTEIVTEIRECLATEKSGTVLSHDDTDVRIRFADVLEAAHWISNYTKGGGLDADGVAFETPTTAWDRPVVIVLKIEEYDYMGTD